MRPFRSILSVLAVALTVVAAAPGRAAAQPVPASALQAEVAALLDGTAAQWAGMVTAAGVFQNPFPADIAAGHHSFVPPMLAYALHRAGQRTGSASLVAAAERTWPHSVQPYRASSFDMLGAAYALRTLSLTDARRRHLTAYTAAYGIPLVGRRCLLRPRCWGNLKLVDALAVLAITGAGVRSPNPLARLGHPRRARAAARRIVNVRIGQVADHGLRAMVGHTRLRGTVLSDPPADPLAYHALTTFMLREAIAQLGPRASRHGPARRPRAVRRARRPALPGRRRELPGARAGAGLGARAGRGRARRLGARRGGHPAGPRRALPRGCAARAAAARRAARRPARPPTRPRRAHASHDRRHRRVRPHRRLQRPGAVRPHARPRCARRDPDGAGSDRCRPTGGSPSATRAQAGSASSSNGRVWLAVHKTATDANDLRHDFGALAIRRRTPAGWLDLLAPRPKTQITPDSGGPALMYLGQPLRPTGFAIHAHGRTIIVNGAYRANDRIVRRAQFRWRLTRRGVRLRVAGAHRGDRFRLLAFTAAGTGTASRRALVAAGARWRFDRPIRVRRLPGYHSGPVENLDALEARLTAPRSGRFVVTIGS